MQHGHILMIAAASIQYTCTMPITNWSYEVSSPDGSKRAIVRTRGLKPHRLELRVESARQTKTVFAQDYSEVFVGFCELHWTRDSRVIEMLATNTVGSHNAIFAYDTVAD